MKVTGFDNREHVLSLKFKQGNCSSGHLEARTLLKKIFPNDSIYEEVTLKGSKKAASEANLAADFFIPAHKIIVEVHGKQHYEYVAHFHESKSNFLESKKRDSRKKEWCYINNIIYIELPTGKENEWERRIIDAISS